MYYAPNVTNKEIGAEGPKPAEFQYLLKYGKWKHSPYPFIIMQGPHGYMIQPRGDAERAVITNEFKPMLARLAKINKNWVLPDSRHMDMSHHHNM